MARSVEEQVGVKPRDEVPVEEFSVPAQDLANGQDKPAAEREDWLPDNFESPEELAKSWLESQQALTRAHQRASAAEASAEELARRMSALEEQVQRQPQQPQAAYDPATDMLLAAEAAALEDQDFLRAGQIRDARNLQLSQAAFQMWQQQQQQPDTGQQETLNQLFAVQTEGLVAQRYGEEWGRLREPVTELLRQHPHLVPETRDPHQAAQAIGLVADMVRAQQLAEQRAELNNQQNASAQAKRMAQTAHGGSGPRQGQLSPADALVEVWRGLSRPYGSS